MPREISKTAVREGNSPKALAQAITELKAASIPHETVYHADGVKTTFRFGQGFSFTFVEPPSLGISAFIGGGWDWDKGPYIVLNKFDRDLILRGSGGLLTAAICRIPAVGWAACSVAGAISIHSWRIDQER